MDYDKVLEKLGELGKWQKRTLALLWLPAIMGGAMVLLGCFTLLHPTHYRCKIEGCDNDDFEFGDFEERWMKEDLFPCVANKAMNACSEHEKYCMYYKPRIVDGQCIRNLTNKVEESNEDSEFTYEISEIEITVIR